MWATIALLFFKGVFIRVRYRVIWDKDEIAIVDRHKLESVLFSVNKSTYFPASSDFLLCLPENSNSVAVFQQDDAHLDKGVEAQNSPNRICHFSDDIFLLVSGFSAKTLQ